jgi:hypothetical protein
LKTTAACLPIRAASSALRIDDIEGYNTYSSLEALPLRRFHFE